MSETASILVLSSEDLSDEGAVNARETFRLADPPPREMKVRVDTRFLDLSVGTFNNTIQVYLSKYLLDCVWRDADDPSERMTSSSGTSRSRRLKVYLYAGDPSVSTVRLLVEPVYREGQGDRPDFFLYRDQNYIHEKAHNPYDTNLGLSLDLYFENQFTQQTEAFVDPGLYLGVLSAQAILALRSTSLITIEWKLDREDFPSPFWYNKFLVGSSVWNPRAGKAGEFEITANGTSYALYYQQMNSVAVAETGGPYFPLSLYTLEQPTNRVVAPFLETSTVYDVSDPADGELHPLNNANVTAFISQVAIAGSQDLASLDVSGMPVLAPSDEAAFRVPLYNAASATVHAAFPLYQTTDPAPPLRFQDTMTNGNATSSLHFPNGAWRGNVLSSQPTNVPGWWSPFPWEQKLTADQLAIANETQAYPVGSSQYRYQLLDCHDYLFMDPGSAWNEHEHAGNTATVGERALQFDFGLGREYFVNKFQLLFPRSQENHQPYRLLASVQKAFRASAENVVVNTPAAFWLGGIQFRHPSGSRGNPGTYRYLNTHSQSGVGLDDTYTPLWTVAPRQAGPTPAFPSPQDGGVRELTADDYDTTPAARGRARVVKASLQHLPSWYVQPPNAVNPALDFQRQEFGPFTQGATLAALKDPLLCKAFMPPAQTTVPAGKLETFDSANVSYFFDLPSYVLSPQSAGPLGTRLYTRRTDPTWQSQGQGMTETEWRSVASSTFGDRLAAATGNAATGQGNVWTYNGSLWVARPQAGSREWRSVALSGDGGTIMAAPTGNALVRSTDGGNAWTTVNGNLWTYNPAVPELWTSPGLGAPIAKNWVHVALASDGRTGFAAAANDRLYKYVVGNGGKLSISINRPSTASPFVDIAMSMDGSVTAGVTSLERAVQINEELGTRGEWYGSSPSNTLWNNIGYYTCVALNPAGSRVIVGTNYNGFIKAAAPDWGLSRLTNIPSEFVEIVWQRVVFAGPNALWAADSTGKLYRIDVSNWSSPAWTAVGPLGASQGSTVRLHASRLGAVIAAVRNGGVFFNATNSVSGWQAQSALPSAAAWADVTIAADGTTAAAVVQGGSVYVGAVGSGGAVAWRVIAPLGSRNWTVVALSNSATSMYVGEALGYLYGAADGPAFHTWQRDVTPTLSFSTWLPVTNESWARLFLQNTRGLVMTTNSQRLLLLDDAPPTTVYTQEMLISRLDDQSLNWRQVACSDDGAVALAVVYGGPVYITRDGGETWAQAPTVGSRNWTCVAVTRNGTLAIAMADTGHIALATTTTSNPVNLAARLDAWTLSTTYTGAGVLPWTAVAVNDAFSALVATAGSLGIFVSSTQGLVWTRDDDRIVTVSLQTSQAWGSVAASGDGSIAIAAPSNGFVRVVRGGETYYRMSYSAGSLAALKDTSPKLAVPLSNNGPDFFLPSEASSLGVPDIAASTINTDIYQWFLSRYSVYRVAADLQPSPPTSSQLLDPTTFKVYGRPDGSMILTNDTPVSYLLEDVVGPTNVLVGTLLSNGVTRTYLIHPYFTTDNGDVSVQEYLAQTALVVQPLVTKYVLPSLPLTKSSIVINSATLDNGRLVVNWNNEDYTITIPDGTYANVNMLNLAFQDEMGNLGMYTETPFLGGSLRTYYLRFQDTAEGAKLTVDPVPRGPGDGSITFPSSPSGNVWPYNTDTDTVSDPTITVAAGGFGDVVGFLPGQHPTGERLGGSGIGMTTKSSDFLPPQWVVANLAGAVTTFTDASDVFPNMYVTTGDREPMLDYVVKESYYFAPGYDQYDTRTTGTQNGVVWLEPGDAGESQKVVNPSFGTGRYFGLGFGSFLFDKENPADANGVYTRGKGNLLKLYSFRPITQLYSFSTDSGFLKDKTATATAPATFTNVVQKGMLANVALKTAGSKYAGKDTTVAFLQPTLDDAVQGAYYDPPSGTFKDTPMLLLSTTSPEIVRQASNNAVSTARHAVVSFTMEDDVTSAPLQTFTPSQKTPLNRSAEFHLRFVRGGSGSSS
jgi:hypothetical protein